MRNESEVIRTYLAGARAEFPHIEAVAFWTNVAKVVEEIKEAARENAEQLAFVGWIHYDPRNIDRVRALLKSVAADQDWSADCLEAAAILENAKPCP